MNNRLNPTERSHLERVKMLHCAVCGAEPPSEAHHIVQGQQYTTIPLCKDCHTGSRNGIHGQKLVWAVFKKTELSCLNDTVRRLLQQNRIVK